jgi:lipopolysaccharide export LptBFGC system permease protein LptF
MATLTHRQPLPRVGMTLLRLPILDGYLLREMTGPFMFALGAFLLFWALNIFFLAADYIINQHAPFFLVLRFVVFRIPQATPMAFPFASLFAALLAMGRLMGDNEVTAMRTAGIPVMRVAFSPLVFGALMFAGAYAINEWVAPRSVDLSTRTFYQIIYHTDALPVEPQFFRKDPDTGNTFYVTQVASDNKTMLDVQIFKPAKYGMWNETLQAKTATVLGSSLVLHDVVDTRYNNDGFLTNQQRFHRLAAGRDRIAVRKPGEQRSLDDEQQDAPNASEHAASPRHRRHGNGKSANQSGRQARMAFFVHYRGRCRASAGAALWQARTHAWNRALDHRVFRLLLDGIGGIGIRPQWSTQSLFCSVVAEHRHGDRRCGIAPARRALNQRDRRNGAVAA